MIANGRRRGAAAMLLPLLLSSCFTLNLWGIQPSVQQSAYSGRTELHFELDDEADWSLGQVGMRALGTPFAAALDVLTSPFQLFLAYNYGD